MSFWKAKNEKDLKSEEFEQLSRRIVSLVSEVDILANRVELLGSSFRKMNGRIAVMTREFKSEESEKDINNDKVYL